jgi:uncharacterized protein (TIGR03437 family)
VLKVALNSVDSVHQQERPFCRHNYENHKKGGMKLILLTVFTLFETLSAQTIVAGGGAPPVYRGFQSLATSATLGGVTAVAIGQDATVYIIDASYHVILSVSPNGNIALIAGTGSFGYGQPDGPATQVSITPGAIAADPLGSVYFSEGYRIRKVSHGLITTVAGTGTSGFFGDGGPATAAQLAGPSNLACDPSGNLYFSDVTRIRKISTSGTITTVAGNGTVATGGDGGLATAANLVNVGGLAFDASTSYIYFSQSPNTIRRFKEGSTIEEYAPNPSCLLCGLDFNTFGPIAVDHSGTVFVVEYGFLAFPVGQIGIVSPNGTITAVAGDFGQGYSGDGGPAISASIYPSGIGLDDAGNLYVADVSNFRVRKITNGIITTIAGTGNYRFTGDGGPATEAQLWDPGPLAADSMGDLYIADRQNYRIRKVNSSGTTTTIAGNGIDSSAGDGGSALAASFSYVGGIALDLTGNLWISDQNRIRRITVGGLISTVVGQTQAGFSGDGGAALAVTLNGPTALAFDGSGSLYFVDAGNYRVRKLSAGGIVSTVAGNGNYTASGDNGPAISAGMYPTGIAVDASGSLYISDIIAGTIRKVTNGIITHFAGGGSGGDGGPASTAGIFPQDIALDTTGNLYVCEGVGVRRISSSGIIGTLTANTGCSGLTTDSNGNLYASEPNVVYEIVAAPLLQPQINIGGVTLGGGFTPGTVVPGAILSIFGSNFSSIESTPAGPPLPTNVGGVQVLLNGEAAPLFYVSPTQLNIQAPFDLVVGQTVVVIVQNGGGQSPPQILRVASYQPGIFTISGFGNQGAILIAGTDIVAMPVTPGIPSSPVKAGASISVFATGLGLTDPTVPTNSAAPTTTLATVRTAVSVTVGGLSATVTFAGLTPGFMGLYQVNAILPSGVPTGNAVQVVLIQGGITSNTATLAIQ